MISLKVNGIPRSTESADATLYDFLRNELRLKGVRDAGDNGESGSAAVIVNGTAVNSCAVKMKDLENARVETVEGLMKDGAYHPLQKAFLKLSAFQCGYCTPGFLMEAKALLDRNPSPTADEVRKAIQGHICRCTGYRRIVDAVLLAAEELRGETVIDLTSGDGGMGAEVVRKDGPAKVTGAPIFTDDFEFDNMLEGAFAWPEYPNAKILSIDVEEAKKMPGVVAVATAADIPGSKVFGQGFFPQQPVIAEDRVRYVGDPLAVVYAETEAQARAAAKKVHAEYEVLPVLTDMDESLKNDGLKVYPEYENGNICSHNHTHKGDVERGFAMSDAIVEGDYTTSAIDHAYLEPDAAIALFDSDGKLLVHGAEQNPMGLRRDLAMCLGMSEDDLRVIVHPCGGGFGGREEPSVHIQAALGTLMTGRPVRIVFNREEVNFFTTKRHAMHMHYKIGASTDGTMQAIEIRTIGDTGAYSSSGPYVLFRACAFGAGCYHFPNAHIDTWAVYTNNTTAGSMRGFGSTQPTFALECAVDELAEKIGMDPYEFRHKNGLRVGDQTVTGHVLDYSCGYLECLEAVKEGVKRDGIPAPSGPHKKVGVGYASSMKNVGLGPGMPDTAWAQVWLGKDGRIKLSSGGAELGQGHDTIAVQITAEAIGVSYDRIDILPIDSNYTMDAGITTASRITFIAGNACKGAGLAFCEKMLDTVSEISGIKKSYLITTSDGVEGIGPHKDYAITFREIADAASEKGIEVYAKFFYQAPTLNPLEECSDNFDNHIRHLHFAYDFSAQAVVVEVDEETGKVEVLKVFAADDVGRAVNPALVAGQIEGGVAMGIGMALQEAYIQDENAEVVTKDLKSLHLPRALDVPMELHPIIIEEGHPYGPFGAKGVGELPLNATAPAIANAIYDAVGVRLHHLPMRPVDILKALKEKKG